MLFCAETPANFSKAGMILRNSALLVLETLTAMNSFHKPVESPEQKIRDA